MHFTGVPLTTLIQIGALAGAMVVVFYILKLRRRPVAVPFSKIWNRILRDKEATSLFSQLKRLLSLLLQLALLALLLLALGDPRTAANVLEGRNIVVLIDSSASMQATDVLPSRIDAAKERVRTMVRGLSGTDRMLIAQMDAAATPLTTMTGEIAELEAGVAKVLATDASADFPRALRFAADSLRGLSSPEIIVVSDGALGEAADVAGPVHLGDIKLSYVPIGDQTRAKNVAITTFSVRRYPLDKSRYEVMLEVQNLSEEAVEVELSLLGDGQLTDLTRLRLNPHEKLPRFYPNLSGASKTLEAKLALADGTHDDLPADDHAYALLPERRRARVQVVTAGNMFLEAALLLDEYLDVTSVSPAAYPAKGTFDVTIFDNVAPVVAPGSGSVLYLNPTGTDVPFEVGKLVEDDDKNYKLGFDEMDAKSPLLRYLALSDVNIARARTLKGVKEDKVIASSYKGPLLLQGRRAGTKFVALGFDIRESDLPLRVAWPLFLLNTINDFVEEDTSYISSFRTGSVWNIPVASAAAEATLELPGGEKRKVPVKDGRAVFLGQHAGFYKISTGPSAEESSMFAANLSDVAESTIKPRENLEVDGHAASAASEFKIGVRREMWIYLLLAVLLVTTIEWVTYHRRITV
ncbi:MAG: VWA domain-containing protein [Minicystis sp.]